MKIEVRSSSNFHLKLIVPNGLLLNRFTLSQLGKLNGKSDRLVEAGKTAQLCGTNEESAAVSVQEMLDTEKGIICIGDEEKQLTKEQLAILLEAVKKAKKCAHGLPLLEVESEDGEYFRLEL